MEALQSRGFLVWARAVATTGATDGAKSRPSRVCEARAPDAGERGGGSGASERSRGGCDPLRDHPQRVMLCDQLGPSLAVLTSEAKFGEEWWDERAAE